MCLGHHIHHNLSLAKAAEFLANQSIRLQSSGSEALNTAQDTAVELRNTSARGRYSSRAADAIEYDVVSEKVGTTAAAGLRRMTVR